MRVSYILIALLLLALCGTLFSQILLDPIAIASYSPNTTGSETYNSLFEHMNDSYNVVNTNYNTSSNNLNTEENANLFDLGSGLLSSIKILGNLLTLDTIDHIVNDISGILGLNSTITAIIILMIFVIILFTIISAIIRWKT